MAAEVRIKANFRESENMTASFSENDSMTADFGETTFIRTDNYDDLLNKPQINGVELMGDKSFEDLGDAPLTNLEIKAIFDSIFNN